MNNKSIIIFGVVIIVAIYIVYTSIIGYTSTMNREPILISGNKTGSTPLQIPAKRIQKSQDGEYGVEFTYSFWLNLNNISKNKFQHIFHKGFIAEPKISTDKTQPVSIQAPGVWLAKGKNKLIINMNTFSSVKETCEISNLPMNKWFHVTIVLMNKYIDVYINGRLKKRCKLNGIPKQNYNDLYINMFDGFSGIISKFRYFAHALPYFRIAQMVKDGPAASNCIDTGDSVPSYLASDYWLQPDYPDTPTPAPTPTPTPTPSPTPGPPGTDRYVCINGTCSASVGGDYKTIDECKNNIKDGKCVVSTKGSCEGPGIVDGSISYQCNKALKKLIV
tara:strand:- start:2447 stop:3445 length:999 start_codon:yes stop_codon:yes gene_type:complete